MTGTTYPTISPTSSASVSDLPIEIVNIVPGSTVNSLSGTIGPIPSIQVSPGLLGLNNNQDLSANMQNTQNGSITTSSGFIGAVVGGFILLGILVVAGVVVMKYRKNLKKNKDNDDINKDGNQKENPMIRVEGTSLTPITPTHYEGISLNPVLAKRMSPSVLSNQAVRMLGSNTNSAEIYRSPENSTSKASIGKISGRLDHAKEINVKPEYIKVLNNQGYAITEKSMAKLHNPGNRLSVDRLNKKRMLDTYDSRDNKVEFQAIPSRPINKHKIEFPAQLSGIPEGQRGRMPHLSIYNLYNKEIK